PALEINRPQIVGGFYNRARTMYRQSYRCRSAAPPTEKARALEDALDCRNRRHRITVHPRRAVRASRVVYKPLDAALFEPCEPLVRSLATDAVLARQLRNRSFLRQCSQNELSSYAHDRPPGTDQGTSQDIGNSGAGGGDTIGAS